MSVDPVAHNRVAWDRQVDQGNEWSRPISAETVASARASARAGDWSVVLISYQPVDRSWFPADLAGADVLCLASGGGQQGPTLAAAGARVTVLDNSPRQLEQDELVAQRDNLPLRTMLGDMRDLSAFADSSFEPGWNSTAGA
jgi:2-polyprenyl-3-methyl-5-hydroxy-6-metoxy-1,4-benzoquinol methylase